MIHEKGGQMKDKIDAALDVTAGVGALAVSITSVNEYMQFIILLLTIIYGVYRVIEMHEKRKDRKAGK
jgi:hypothetical protein